MCEAEICVLPLQIFFYQKSQGSWTSFLIYTLPCLPWTIELMGAWKWTLKNKFLIPGVIIPRKLWRKGRGMWVESREGALHPGPPGKASDWTTVWKRMLQNPRKAKMADLSIRGQHGTLLLSAKCWNLLWWKRTTQTSQVQKWWVSRGKL